MLHFTSKLRAALLLSFIRLFFTTTSFSQTTTTYTAIANGNFTSSSTWSGGVVPPPTTVGTSISNDHIIIPQGITVTLDTNLNINTGSFPGKLTVEGMLNGLPGRHISAGNLISNTGIITVDSIYLYTIFSGAKSIINANKCEMKNYNMAGTLNIKKMLHLPKTNTSSIHGTINFDNHAWLIKTDNPSMITIGTGAINYADTMNVVNRILITKPNVDIDTTLFNRQIDTFIIDLAPNVAPPQQTSTISIAHKDLYFNGAMIIRSGNLKLNKHKLTFGPNAKIYCNSNIGNIEADDQAEIIVNANDLGGKFMFYPGAPSYNVKPADTIKNFTMNMGSSTSKATIGSSLTIANKLELQKGKLHLDSAQLKMQSGSNAIIAYAGPNSYITSNFGGALHMDVTTSDTTIFPVGTPAHYAPIYVKNNSSSNDVYKVGAVAGVLDTATRGFDIASQEPCVGATWWVNPSAATGSNADVTIKWPAALEVNGFNRAQSFITTYLYSQTKWDTQTSTSAAAQSGNFYAHTETVNNFDTGKANYFSVFDGMTSLANLSVNSLTANNKITLYPNPTSGDATIAMKLDQTQTIAITLTDVSGRIVYNKAATQYSNGQHIVSLPTNSLTSGIYFVQLTNEGGTLLNSGKLLKQ